MIVAENITKSYGSQALFSGVRFRINKGERVGLVGRNGHGKTTLLRIINGEEQPDSGNIIIPRGYRIGYVHQQIDFRENTVLEEAVTGMENQDEHNHWKAEKILAGLGFSSTDMTRHPLEFSGGFQVRLNLAKVLVSEPDMLLLDEPTNYLDITSIRWTEQFLLQWPREIILVTHDRSFMDRIVTHIVGLHRKRTRKIAGNTEKFYTHIAQEEEIHEKTRINDERRRKQVETFISRFRAKARLGNLVQSRIKNLAKQEKLEKLEAIKNLEFSFREQPVSARFILSAEDISFAYTPGESIIENFSVTIANHDRVCIIGRNGRGKTTLLKLLAGTLQTDKGRISCNPGVKKGVFEQTNLSSLVNSRTVEEEIMASSDTGDRQLARDICGAMMFEGDNALKKIGVISGGEKSRVMLGKLIVSPSNLLLLDEPTNHLDMQSCDALLAALDSFSGAIIMVTHNEMFLHALAQRLIVFQDDRVYLFEGTYQSFLEKVGWHQTETMLDKTIEKKSAPPVAKLTKKELRRRRSEIITERGRTLGPIEQSIKETEGLIESNEKKLKECTQLMQEAAESGNSSKIAELSRQMHSCQVRIDQLFTDLEALTDRFDEQKTLFEKKLSEIV